MKLLEELAQCGSLDARYDVILKRTWQASDEELIDFPNRHRLQTALKLLCPKTQAFALRIAASTAEIAPSDLRQLAPHKYRSLYE